MAINKPRSLIPRHIEWIDSDQAASGAGASAHSDLGTKLIRNTRALAAHCKRAFGHSFPEQGSGAADLVLQPTIRYPSGRVIGAWHIQPTSAKGIVEGYIRCSLANEETAFVSLSERTYNYVTPGFRSGELLEITGTGSMENYGPVYLPFNGVTDLDVSFIIYPNIDSDPGSVESGDVIFSGISNRNTFITDSTGAALIHAWVLAGTEYDHVVRLLSGGVPMTVWSNIVDVLTTTNTDDTITFNPPMNSNLLIRIPKGGVTWESTLVFPVTVSTTYVREMSFPDSDYVEVFGP